MLKNFGKSSTFDFNLLVYTDFDNVKYEYMRREYEISDIAYFIGLKRVYAISQIT